MLDPSEHPKEYKHVHIKNLKIGHEVLYWQTDVFQLFSIGDPLRSTVIRIVQPTPMEYEYTVTLADGTVQQVEEEARVWVCR